MSYVSSNPIRSVSTAKPSAVALIPFLVFIGLIMGTAVFMSLAGEERPFGYMSAGVAMFFAVVSAFVIYKGDTERKFNTFIAGAGESNIVIMVLTVLLAGAFSQVATVSGGVESFVNLALTLIPSSFLIPGLFLAAGLMSLATGSSSGTAAALGAIAISIGQTADLNLPMVFAAVLSGAFLGDNLSIISDTTIVVTRGQGVRMKDKFRLNWKIAVPAMILALIMFIVFGAQKAAVNPEVGDYNIFEVIPYFLVLALAIAGMNVFKVLTLGLISSGIVGMATGSMNFITFCQAIMDGFGGMIEIVVLAIFIGGLSHMMARAGGLEFIVSNVKKLIRGRKSAEVGISAIVALIDVAIANNTAALVATNDVCKETSAQYRVDPRRTASLMDIFGCVAQGILPYGNQLLLLVGIGGSLVSPIEVIPYMWYPILLGLVALVSIFIPFADGAIKRNPWDWAKGAPELDR